jgi:hypothetical protein
MMGAVTDDNTGKLFDKILDELESLSKGREDDRKILNKLVGNVSLVSKDLETMNSKVTEHHEFINGNGKEGAKIELNNLNTYMKDCKTEKTEEIKEKKSYSRKINLALVVMVGGFILNFIFWYITTGGPK